MFRTKPIVMVLAGVFMILTFSAFNVIAHDAAMVEKTGQTQCWNNDGNPMSCAGTGQDGEYKKGIASPSPRFTDHGNGTVTDNMTGLMWTKDASIIPDPYDWLYACWGVRGWEFGTSGCGLYNDWRVPNAKELLSLIDLGHHGPALPSGHPFVNVQDNYWSSTTIEGIPTAAWEMSMYRGGLNFGLKTNHSYIWPVRGGN